MSELMGNWKRDIMCGEVREAHVGQVMTVMGWVDTRRDLGSLVFIDLRDRTGLLQCVFDQGKYPEDFSKVESIRSEYVLAIRGKIVLREEETVNDKIATGTVELRAESLKILSKSETPPFYIEDGINTREDLRLKYRYLDLRRPEMLKNVLLRHRLAKVTRDYLSENGFIEVETPMLTISTPEGARDFLVPSRLSPGSFYALPQSPQQFKQLLMIAGVDRYYQIARCFRDEDLRADRQPEFTQIDLEMSFVNEDDVMIINEGLAKALFKEAWGKELKLPLERISYAEAMNKYGSDKPDRRFGMELCDISDIARDAAFNVFASNVKAGGSARGINLKNGCNMLARRDLDALVEYVKQFGAKGMAWINVKENELQSPITKFFTKEEMSAILERMQAEVGDTLMFVSDTDDNIVFDALGHLRLHLGQKLGLIDYSKLDVFWVTEFPMFEYSKEEKRLVAKHHPFTAPLDEDIELLETAPEKMRSKAYDMIINGIEAGGGSCRIYNRELQEKIFGVLGLSLEQARENFGYFLEAFKYGAPPHAGLAFGFDRLTMILSKQQSIRDVIAFPKLQTGSCALTSAPGKVEQSQLYELGIALVESEDK